MIFGRDIVIELDRRDGGIAAALNGGAVIADEIGVLSLRQQLFDRQRGGIEASEGNEVALERIGIPRPLEVVEREFGS